MKKRFMTTCALMMATVMTLTGCGSKGSDSSDTAATSAPSSTESSTDTSTDTTDSSEPTEISVMVWDRGNAAPGTTVEENTMTKWIQEQVLAACNIKVKYVSVPRSESDDKINIMMAGGSAPDIIFTYDQNIYGNFAANDGLADLTDAYAKYATTISSTTGNIQYMGQIDGKQYAIMKRRGQQTPRHLSYIRKDWLDKLGLAVPTTKEELFTALRAFRDQNPGNVDGVIPWGMGGSADTEKFYLNFIGSYVSELSEKDAYTYSEAMKIFAPGAVDGIKMMNTLYNEGLISKDFATDTTTDIFKQDISSGKVGFTLDDATNIFDYIPVLKAADPNAKFVPLNCFDTPDGTYVNPTEPLYGMFIMVPATSSAKVDACVKYLNWLADPANAENIEFTPEHTVSDAGVPIGLTAEDAAAKGYPGTLPDLNIVNQHFTYVDKKESIVASWLSGYTWEDEAWFGSLYDVMNTGQYLYPTYPVILESEATYLANVTDMAIAYVYKLITCDPAQFDAVQKEEYDRLVNAGLQKILDERAAYYDANVAK